MTRTQPAAPAHGLRTLLNPRSVAVIGASEDQTKFGGRLYRTLLAHRYEGAVYPINPTRDTLFGLKTYPSVDATPTPPDMVVMALPRGKVRDEIAACAARGAKAGIIITAKFSDAGAEGAALEREVVAAAAAHGMRLIGPNCLGLISPANRLVLCSSPALNVERLIESPIGFVTQSGALMGTLFDRAHGMGIGFSHCVSVGNQADLELADFVEFLLDDDRTQVICSYVEGIKSPARFAALARRARELGKPWLMVKAGQTDDGSRAAFSHTASLAGDFAALEAVCRRENVVMLRDPLEMLVLAQAMVRYPRRRVAKVAVITTSGGGGAIAADRLSQAGIPLARFDAGTRERLAEHYSPGQAANPIDIGGRKHEGDDELCKATAEIVLADPDTDLGLVVMTTAPDVPGYMAKLAEGAAGSPKPMLYAMLPGRVGESSRAMLSRAGLPYVDTMGEAVDVLRAWADWSAYAPPDAPRRPEGCALAGVPAAGALGEAESKALLRAAGIPVNRGLVAASVEQALALAPEVGFPLVLKVVSPDIVHKSDVGGVELDIVDAADLQARLQRMRARIAREAPAARIVGFGLQAQERGEVELLVGARRDAQFGAQVVVGAGGTLVEVLADVVVLPAPVDARSARAALDRLKVSRLLAPHRGRPALDVDAVVDAVVRLSWLAHDLERTAPGGDFEIEVNPLQVRLQGRGVVAVDARARIGAAEPAAS